MAHALGLRTIWDICSPLNTFVLSEKAAATPDPEGNFIERYIAEQQRAKRDVKGCTKRPFPGFVNLDE